MPARGMTGRVVAGVAAGVVAGVALALAFLFAQQKASLHGLSHAINATTPSKVGKGAPALDPCDECLALSALGAGVTSHSAGLAAPVAQHARLAAAAPVAPSAALRLAFHSRAPPIPV